MRPIVCQQCNGTGMVHQQLKDLSGKGRDGVRDWHITPCDQTARHNGIVNLDEYYDSWHLPRKESNDCLNNDPGQTQ
jgi:hypothetical protein